MRLFMGAKKVPSSLKSLEKPKDEFHEASWGKSERKKPHVNIGTIGHVDDGKATLTTTLTTTLASMGTSAPKKYDKIDVAPKEKAKGITINTATIEYETKSIHYAHVDFHGHADYVKNMISGATKMDGTILVVSGVDVKNMIFGATQMDGAILVVSGADDPMPHTKEHILLAKKVGVPNVVVLLNKQDHVDDKELIQVVELAVREPLSAYDFP